MDRPVRVVAALVNEGELAVAQHVWTADPAPFELLEWVAGDGPQTRHLAGIELTRRMADSTATITADGTHVGPDDLTVDELVAAASCLVDDDLAGLAHATEGALARTRLRLLLEDALFDPAARAVAIDRLASLAARETRRQDDVEGLFDP